MKLRKKPRAVSWLAVITLIFLGIALVAYNQASLPLLNNPVTSLASISNPPPDLEDAITDAVQRLPYQPESPSERWIITYLSVDPGNSWGIASVSLIDEMQEGGFIAGPFYLVAQNLSNWTVLSKFDINWSKWVGQVPDTLLPPETKRYWLAESPGLRSLNEQFLQTAVTYYFPWSYGTKAMVSRGYHSGEYPIDFALQGGSVVAASDGQVIDAKWTGTVQCQCRVWENGKCEGGWYYPGQYNKACPSTEANYVKIKDSSGKESIYYHLAYDSVPTNFRGPYPQQVFHGQTIGQQGSTGWATGPHLHFAIISGNTTVKFTITNGDEEISSDQLVAHFERTSYNKFSNVTGYIEAPAGDIWLNGTTLVSGWAKVDGSTIAQVEIYIDGIKRGDGIYGDPRPDAGGNYGFHWDWTTTGVSDGSHEIKVKAVASNGVSSWLPYVGAGNPTSVLVKIDNFAPGFPANTVAYSNCTALTNQWQNTCGDPNFTWSPADDHGGSGVKDYLVYWDKKDPNGIPTQPTNGMQAYKPPPIDRSSVYYLRVAPVDGLNRQGTAISLFVFRYDITPPSGAIEIQNGAGNTNQVNVSLNIDATDGESLPANLRMLLSNNTVSWIEQPYETPYAWSIPALDRHNIPVYLQVKDQAGNLSSVISDTIYLNLTAATPRSNNYLLCQSVLDSAGSVNPASTSFSLTSLLGQAWASGEPSGISAEFVNRSGFLANTDACLLADVPPPSFGYFISPSVVASGGSLRGSTSYQVGDTLGQPLAADASPQASVSFRLISGFWGGQEGDIPARPANMPEMAGIAAVPTPPAPITPPQPGYFGVMIEENTQYTSQKNAVLTIAAPHAREMRLSLNPVYADDGWLPYSTTTTLALSTTAPEAQPQFVYIWFRDDQGDTVYGPFVDSIWYDRTGPQGSITILASEEMTNTIGLWLDAYDGLSGVSLMRISTSPDLADAEWVRYQSIWEWVLADPTHIPLFYIQFQDQAGNVSPVYNSGDEVIPPDNYQIYLPLTRR